MKPNKIAHFLFMLLVLGACGEKKPSTLFRLVAPQESGIYFSNDLNETYEENMLFFSNFYTGGGIGVIDVNNDGLFDLYFGGNQVSSKLYLNLGDLKFKDITESAGVGTDRWITGISVVDINNDGMDDLYLSVSGFTHLNSTENLLFINNGDLTFSEAAESYGLAEKEQTTHTSFFDYDQDGDLDAFMAINPTDFTLYYMNRIKKPQIDGQARSTDKLFRNNGNGLFEDVSQEAGILYEGYSLGVNTSDFSGDGLIDIYVTNDFITNDILYVNQGDGTFENQLKERFDLISYASMGNDVADINNDGHLDLITLDMLPEDNYREKKLVPTSNYNLYQMILNMGYHPQFSRNMLQLNRGDGTFSEIGQAAGISKTDWSWSSIFADFDNDGHKDLFVTNGFRRELGDLDYLNYDENSPFVNPAGDLAKQIDGINNTEGVPLPNYAFKNNADATFTKVAEEWGLDQLSYSNGAAVVDLDLDGDLDIVVNNIDEPAFLYENNINEGADNHFFRLRFSSPENASAGIGANITIKTGDSLQMVHLNPYRGYLSTNEDVIHFGLGDVEIIDSLIIKWPDGTSSFATNLRSDTLFTLNQKSDFLQPLERLKKKKHNPKFIDITDKSRIHFTHKENNQVDFHKQFLLPHQHSKLGPSIAVGDINGDGLDDCFIGGAKGQLGRFFIQDSNATFTERPLDQHQEFEDLGALLFDSDNDGDNDLYVVSGGTFDQNASKLYQDRLYLNDGNGHFSYSPGLLPGITTSGSSVSGVDFDGDGDIDLFVAGRVVPGEYPMTPRNYLLENVDGRFHDITHKVGASLKNIGMVSQALWSDYDNDHDLDLLLVGEWMSVTILTNTGKEENMFVNDTEHYGLENTKGWWNSITPVDLNGDGLIDYICGNLGSNNDYKASEQNPLIVRYKDFDLNGTIDPIFLKDYGDGYYPIASRDAFLSQLSELRAKYPTYESYAKTKGESILDNERMAGSKTFEASMLKSIVLINLPQGGFEIHELPTEGQFSPIYGALPVLLDDTTIERAILSGNSMASNVGSGPYLALTGLSLGWSENGLTLEKTKDMGLNLSGDRKAISSIRLANGQWAVISSVNDGTLSLHGLKSSFDGLNFESDEYRAEIMLSNERKVVRDCHYGFGYLSQSTRKLMLPKNWVQVNFFKYNGEKRTVHRENQKSFSN